MRRVLSLKVKTWEMRQLALLRVRIAFSPAGRVTHPTQLKRPPGNRRPFLQGRIVPTEAKPSKLSGQILGAGKVRVKRFLRLKLLYFQ
jgi:hypothetical protein